MTIDLSSFDLSELPWMPLTERSNFPKQPAIYFAIDESEIVLYVGRSINPRKRWGKHHKFDELSQKGNIKIAYLLIGSSSLLPQMESLFIGWYNPPLNCTFGSEIKPDGLLSEQLVFIDRVNEKYSKRELPKILQRFRRRRIPASTLDYWLKNLSIRPDESGEYSKQDVQLLARLILELERGKTMAEIKNKLAFA